jgi:hypothetical protein
MHAPLAYPWLYIEWVSASLNIQFPRYADIGLFKKLYKLQMKLEKWMVRCQGQDVK